MTQYWLGIAVQDHIEKGIAEGFAQLGHGRHDAVAALNKGDWLVYYAPRRSMVQAEGVQQFIGLGQVKSETPYQHRVNENFAPWRHDVSYISDAKPASIRPLLGQLEFTRDLGRRWGMALRRSQLPLSRHDFEMIASAMGVDAKPWE